MPVNLKRTIVVVLGASKFPNHPSFQDSGGTAFQASASAFADCLEKHFGSEWRRDYLLDLFDSEASAREQVKELEKFLRQHRSESDRLILYYVGHGSFYSGNEYFLAVRDTEKEYESYSGLVTSALAGAIRRHFAKGKSYLILDCCFAGEVVEAFQSDALTRKVDEDTFRAFPEMGTSLLCASSKHDVALSTGTCQLTQFSECLVEVLVKGINGKGETLNLRDVGTAVGDMVREKFGVAAVNPEVHSPRQQSHDIAELPLFPNAAYRPTLEALRPKLATDLNDEEHHRRIGAAHELGRLLRSKDAAWRTVAETALRERLEVERDVEVLPAIREALTAAVDARLVTPHDSTQEVTVATQSMIERRYGTGFKTTQRRPKRIRNVPTILIILALGLGILGIGYTVSKRITTSQTLSTMVDDMRRAVNEGRFLDAEKHLPEIEKLEPDSNVLASLESQLATARSEDENIRRQKKIELLLEKAQLASENGTRTTPKSDNALEHFSAVLQLDATNTTALNGIDRLREDSLSEMYRALNAGDFESANRHLKEAERIAEIFKDDSVGQKAVEKAQLAFEKAQPAIQNAQKITTFLKKAEIAFGYDRLTSPAASSANDYYDSILAIDNTNKDALRGKQRIVERYVAMANSAIRKRELASAENYLDRADLVKQNTVEVMTARRKLNAEKQDARQMAEAERTRPLRHFQDNLSIGSLGPMMVILPPGHFEMGLSDSEIDRPDRGLPIHSVSIERAFAIGKYEVTFSEYDIFAKSTGRSLPDDQGWGRGKHPVINVTWADAVEYAKWLSEQSGEAYRLPTESEWEYAASGQMTTRYWWGQEIEYGHANCRVCNSVAAEKTLPVGSFKEMGENGFFLQDVSGNVDEWVMDCWHKNYNGAPNDGSAWYEEGDGECEDRVLRGGSWIDGQMILRLADRSRQARYKGNKVVGFRVAMSL